MFHLLILTVDGEYTIKKKITAAILFEEFCNYYPFEHLELTYDSVILAQTKPNTNQYPGQIFRPYCNQHFFTVILALIYMYIKGLVENI